MSIRLRINAIELQTDGGPVRHRFSGPLTVLSGPVGVGKSTIFELIKHAVGGTARIAPVARDHISEVRVDLEIGDHVLRLSRRVGSEAGSVSVRDTRDGVDLGDFPVAVGRGGDPESTISSLLLTYMGLPTGVYSTSQARSSRITFNSVWSFVYVEQREIDRSVARNTDPYSEPSRKATFELLFGLTDSRVLGLRKQEREAEERVARASRDEQTVKAFLANSRTRTRSEAQAAFDEERERREQATRRLAALQVEADAVRGEVGVVRDLVLQAREELGRFHARQVEVDFAREEHVRLLNRLGSRAAEVARATRARSILAPIEFVVCPRCAQSIRGLVRPEGACQLCGQPEPPADALLSRRSAEETTRAKAQIDEVETLLGASTAEGAMVREQVEVARANLVKLEKLLDERTRDFVSPRLEQFTQATAELARAEAVLAAMEDVLRQWDSAHDLEMVRVSGEEDLDRIVEARKGAQDALEDVRRSLLDALSGDYNTMVQRLSVPTVRAAWIDKKTYLPYANGDRFDRISTGGITTALVTAYWLTVLATALRERQTNYPTLLIIDTPRKSIGAQNSQMADELYRQLATLAEANGNRMQVIIADNEIPAGISRRWQDLRFDYDHPTIPTIPHPGPAQVTPLDAD